MKDVRVLDKLLRTREMSNATCKMRILMTQSCQCRGRIKKLQKTWWNGRDSPPRQSTITLRFYSLFFLPMCSQELGTSRDLFP